MTVRRWLAALALTVPTVGAVTVFAPTAVADSTCYTGCTPTTQPTGPNGGGGGSGGSGGQPAPATQAASGGLAFTGADIAEMSAVGAGAIVVGGVLVIRARRRQPA